MISIIISTHNQQHFESLCQNIRQTIGTVHEIIRIENHGQYSLCNAYNQGIKQARYEYLCFVHEDVTFISVNWGYEIFSVFSNNDNIGLIGVAGVKYKTALPFGWHISKLKNMRRGCIFQGQNSYESVFDDFDPGDIKNEIEDVVCLDGVVLFIRKKDIVNKLFDDKLLTGFHGYDTDLSLSIFFSGKQVVVDRRIKIFHYSLGSFGKDKAKAEWKISMKWFGKLPARTKDLKLSYLKVIFKELEIFLWYSSSVLQRKTSKVFKTLKKLLFKSSQI